MWAAFVRQFAAYAITRRGKKLFALIGVLTLCFGAALLIDMQLYMSASFTVLLAGFAAVTYVIQHVKLKRAEHQRLLLKAEAARQRAIAAQARLEPDRHREIRRARYGFWCGAFRCGQCPHRGQRGHAYGRRNRRDSHATRAERRRGGRNRRPHHPDICCAGMAIARSVAPTSSRRFSSHTPRRPRPLAGS